MVFHLSMRDMRLQSIYYPINYEKLADWYYNIFFFLNTDDTNDTNCLLLLMTDRWSALFKNKELILLKD